MIEMKYYLERKIMDILVEVGFEECDTRVRINEDDYIEIDFYQFGEWQQMETECYIDGYESIEDVLEEIKEKYG